MNMYNIQPKNNSDINGFIHSLPLLHVTCKSSSYQVTGSQCINAITPSHNYHFTTNESDNEWFEMEFPNFPIYMQYYSLQVPNQTQSWGWFSPKSWELFGITLEGKTISIDNVTDSQLKGAYKVVTYHISNPNFYIGLRLVMQGVNYGGYKDLRFHKIDVFGSTYFYLHCTSHKSNIHYCAYLFIILYGC